MGRRGGRRPRPRDRHRPLDRPRERHRNRERDRREMTDPEVDGVDEALALVGPPARKPERHRATPWAEARSVAARLGTARPAPTRRVPLEQALGGVLAQPLAALTDLPSFDTSAMDGWAVAGPGPWRVGEGGSVLAGHARTAPLPDGEAVRIATGARVPPGATAVIRSEHSRTDSGGQLHARRDVTHGQDIRPRGQECRSGDHLLPAATPVTPAVLGLAAAAGYDELHIVERPRVEVLVLGDELLTSGLPHDGLIRDALGPMLAPWLRALGADVTVTRRIGDDADALYTAVSGTRADVVITTGGTAAGPVDHVHPVLHKAGAELLVDGVKVRPGHPMLLARLTPASYLVGLPGNPLAAVSGLLTLAEPLLRGLAGRRAPQAHRAAVRDTVHGHPHDTRLVPVTSATGHVTGHTATGHGSTGHPTGRARGSGASASGAPLVVPLHYNGPAMLRGIAAADGLAVVPPGGARAGDVLEILDLPWAATTERCFT
ncbi:molybdopterin molybdotransferase MoeA [Streptomyces lavendulocolor]|uniref:molybdopterin molybdotransferase MoeA n=1 Tax=Streptomyces lavendulocolor TaxID=67316 RepID=UPI003F4D63C9